MARARKIGKKGVNKYIEELKRATIACILDGEVP